MNNSSAKVRQITLAAILTAIILLMAFTPLGYLRVGAVSITFLVIPVVIGGMTLGPLWGGFLGAVFGATSFAQCFMGDAFGAALVSISLPATVLTCFIPRILIGVVAGVLFPAIWKASKNGVLSFVVTAIAGTLTNTILFVGMVIAFFKNSYFGGADVGSIIAIFFTFNMVLELVVNTIVSAGLGAVVDRFVLKAPRYQTAK